MKITKRSITLIIILVVVSSVGLIKWFNSTRVQTIDSVAARSKGPVNAKVQIVEFIDFECPACAYGAGLIHKYMKKYPNDIYVQVKYFPLIRSHRHAMPSALYNECAAQQGKFWEFNTEILASQAQWAPLVTADALFQEMAKKVGLDLVVLNVCLANDETKQVIDDELKLGQSMGIQSTPTYFVNNKMVVGGKSLTEELNTYFPGGIE